MGVGTWRLQGDTVTESVTAALDAGCTHVDTAEGYRNEAAIGEAIAAHERDRGEPVYDYPARDWTGDVYGISQ